MTREETKNVLQVVVSVYQNFNRENITYVINAWWAVLKDYTYSEVTQGLEMFISSDTKGFPPVPGQIIDKIQVFQDYSELNESEAWALVDKALCNSIYGYKEEFARLPLEVQSAVGSAQALHEWAKMDSDTVQSVIRSTFLRTYQKKAAFSREFRKYPKNIQLLIQETAKKTLPDNRIREQGALIPLHEGVSAVHKTDILENIEPDNNLNCKILDLREKFCNQEEKTAT